MRNNFNTQISCLSDSFSNLRVILSTRWSLCDHNVTDFTGCRGTFISLFYGLTGLMGMWLINVEVSWFHSDTHTWYDSSGWVIGLMQRPLLENTQHSQETGIHAPVGIWTHNPSKRVAAHPQLRPRGHRDRLSLPLVFLNYKSTVSQTLQAEYSSISFAFAISIGILTSCVTTGNHEIFCESFVNFNSED
jgi:hypothetical protein